MPAIDLLDKYPKSKRPIDERGSLITEEHREIARRFGPEFFDGDRLVGYGGYSYNARFWTETVARFRNHYDLPDDCRILDVGCAKGFMLHDFSILMPDATLTGIDVSEYAITNAIEDMRPIVSTGSADDLQFDDNSFDLVISINTIHNLPREQCATALIEIERVSRGSAYITVDAWRNNIEKQNMLKWNLTAQTYMHVDDWIELFQEVGYSGDYWWFIAE